MMTDSSRKAKDESGGHHSAGLQGVVVANTAITRIDPIEGRVYFRGYEIDELAAKSTYEEVIFLLWRDRLPTRGELSTFDQTMTTSRDLPPQVLSILGRLGPDCNAIDAVSLGVAALSIFDKRGETFEDNALSIAAKMATLVAAISRIKIRKEPLAPGKDLKHAANFLYMVRGEKPTEDDARLMDGMLILHADHEMTVSTFTARVVASTLADLYSAFGAAVEAFKGPLHAGASEAVVRMLKAVGGPERVEGYLGEKFAKKEKIMGFGHRIFRAGNHITAMMKEYSESMATTEDEKRNLAILLAMEKAMVEKKMIYPNMDYYSGFIFEHLGIPPFLFVPVFAAGRTPGILAHINEQLSDNRLIRPSAEYVGAGTRGYVPIDLR